MRSSDNAVSEADAPCRSSISSSISAEGGSPGLSGVGMAVERDKIVRSGSHVTRPTVEPDPLNRRSSEPIVRYSRDNHHSLTGFSREISDSKRPTEALLHGRSALSETAVTSKMTTTLRLPSFEALGIAAPHPDRISSGGLRNVSAILNQGALSTSSPVSTLKANRGDSVKEESLERSCCASVPSQHSAGPHVQSRMGYLSMLTPPDENFQIDWIETTPGGSTHPTSLQPASQEPPPHSCNSIPMVSSCSSTPADVVNLRGCDGSQDNNRPPQSTIATSNLPQGYGSDQSPFERSWLSDALEVLVSSSVLSTASENEVKVVCQTLPRPPAARLLGRRGEANNKTPSGGSSQDTLPYTPATAVVLVTTAIQNICSTHGRRPFIQVHHAVETALVNLDQLPSSPPLTGGASFIFSGPSSPGYFALSASSRGSRGSGESPGYFARTVFNTAVPVLPAITTNATSTTAPADLASYDDWLKEQENAPLPSPNPIVLPMSHQISILERYIPPTSPEDDQKIFSNFSSTMVDRLFELSPNRGSLLFIYPTRAGAEAFAKEYLGPILEPLLRRLMSMHGVPESFCDSLDKMRAIEFMSSFEGLKGKIENICSRARAEPDESEGRTQKINSGEDDASGRCIRLIHARKATVNLDPDDWKDWWVSQEAPRIKKTISMYYEMGYHMPSDMAPGDLERAIVDGIRPIWTPQIREGQGFKARPKAAPILTPPIEVAIFVLQRFG